MNKTTLDQELNKDIKTKNTKKEKRFIYALALVGAVIGGTAGYLGCKNAGLLDTPEA